MLHMPYILSTPVSENKKCVIAFSEIFGLGKSLVMQVCDQLGFSSQIKCGQLNANQIDRITRCISQNYLVNIDLKNSVINDKSRAVSINSFKGFRHMERLPCRGQRTHGNAQTARKQFAFFSNLPAVARKGTNKRNNKSKIPIKR